MKQNLLSLILVLTGLGWSQAQIATTYYGTGAGTLGLGSCYFGYQAGGIIHVLLVIAIIAVLLKVIRRA